MRELVGSIALGVVVVVGLVAPGLAGVAVAQEAPEHEHPDEVEEPGDLADLQRWLGDRLGEVHVDCSEGIAVGDFDACEDLDEEYESHLERYATVERERTDDEADQQSSEFNQTRTRQAQLAELISEFRQTRTEYEAAREAGDEERARQKARELQQLAARIDALGGDLVGNLREVDNSTEVDLDPAINNTHETTEEVTAYTGAVEQELFESSNLVVDSDGTASFESPATVTGSIRTPAGTAITGAEVVVADDADYRATTTTDENGSFTAAYRPRMTDVGETELSVTYVPDDESPYLGANATTTVDVERTRTSISVESATEEAAFAENVTVTGRLTAAGEAASAVPVQLSADGEALETALTADDGTFTVSGTLPATVSAGNATLEVRGAEPETALRPDSATQPLTVSETETTLSAEVRYVDDAARVEGRLETVDGEAVPDQPVTLAVGDETRTVRTRDDGGYSILTDPPSSDREAIVTYTGTDANLRRSQASVTLGPPPNRVDEVASAIRTRGVLAAWDFRSFVADNPLLGVLAAVAFLMNFGLWVLIARDRLASGGGDDADGPPSSDDDRKEGGPAAERGPEEPTGLTAARTHLESAPSTAVQLAYASVRSALATDDSRTHWEIYQDVKADLDANRQEALRTVTEAFEAATFAPDGVDRDRASEALEDAERCLTAADGGEPADRQR